jgi:Fe-S cluster biogenesis protein NfuA
MNIAQKQELIDKVKLALDRIRPYLIADGGDVHFVDITPEMEVKVRLTGACGDCPLSMQTLKAGIEQTLIQSIPQIKSVSEI